MSFEVDWLRCRQFHSWNQLFYAWNRFSSNQMLPNWKTKTKNAHFFEQPPQYWYRWIRILIWFWTPCSKRRCIRTTKNCTCKQSAHIQSHYSLRKMGIKTTKRWLKTPQGWPAHASYWIDSFGLDSKNTSPSWFCSFRKTSCWPMESWAEIWDFF